MPPCCGSTASARCCEAGESFKGVTLVAAHSRTATLEVDGETLELGLSRRIGTNYEPPQAQVVTIPRDAMLQYQTSRDHQRPQLCRCWWIPAPTWWP